MDSVLRILAILTKEVRQLARDRLTFGMIVGIPLMQILLFGYAINMDVRHLAAGVVDFSGTQASYQLLADVEATQVLDVVEVAYSVPELMALMRQGKITVGVVIPNDFERRLQYPARVAAQLVIDGSDPSLFSVAQRLVNMTFKVRNLPTPRVSGLFEVRNFYNPERRSAVQIVPALIGVILTLTMVLFTSVAIVRERERGNLEMLITTPIRNVELMIGKIVPYVVIGLIQVTIILIVGRVLFSVPIVGSLVDLYLASALFIAASLSLGLVISTFAQTQFQAMQLTFFVFLPQLLLSGFMFPFEGMPILAQQLAIVMPLTHFIDLARGIVLRGAGISELLVSVYPLVLFFVVTMSVAVLRFKKRLD